MDANGKKPSSHSGSTLHQVVSEAVADAYPFRSVEAYKRDSFVSRDAQKEIERRSQGSSSHSGNPSGHSR